MNELKISDFLSSYPEFDDDVEEILGNDIVNKSSLATWDIYRKKEFYDHRLKKIENKPDRPGQYMNHQIIVKNFMSGNTFYDGILLFHSVGSGKTCSSVAIIEGIKNEQSAFKGALVIMKGQGLINNYKNELVNYCTDGIYKPEEYDTEMEKMRRTNRKIESFYQFETFEIFSKLVNNLREDILQEKYNNMIICIDEVHNLRITDDRSQYHSIHKFLHTVKNCKIILMSGTPMRDQPQEIAGIMNLILPLNKQLPIEKNFIEQFLVKQGDSMVVSPNKAQLLKTYFRGRVSYVGTMQSDVEREFMGEKLINYFNLYAVEPTDFQAKAYEQAYSLDLSAGGTKKGKGVYNNSSQASLFVFPDGSWGETGFKKYVKTKKIIDIKGREKINYSLSKEFQGELSGKTVDEKLLKIRKFSVKYADDIEKILNNKDECQFVSLGFVGGSGAILFSLLLELFGLRQANGSEKNPGRRYALITGKNSKSEITRILETHNNPLNKTGKYINVVIGSQVIGEGFTLKNIQSIYVLTPHWNFSETDQGIARGLRLFSHRDLENAGIKVNVKIYLYCLGLYPMEDSIDFKMYKTSEDKDISIKSVEHLMKEASFDCPLNRERNILSAVFDGRRECDYIRCDYECDGIEEKYNGIMGTYEDVDIDVSTYNLFYDQKDVSSVVEKIKNILITKSRVKLYEVMNSIGYTEFVIFKAISQLISGKEVVFDNLGYNCLVKYTGDCLYLTYNITNKGNFFDNFYVENFPLREYPQFSREAEDVHSQNLPNIFEKMRDEENPDKKNELLKNFSIEAKELMLELAIKSLDTGEVMDDDSIRTFIINNFKSYVKKIEKFPDITVSTLLPENIRCFDKKTENWSDCDEEYKKEAEKNIMDSRVSLENNPYGYYGIVESESGKFLIRDVTQLGQKGDRRKVPSGKTCNPSWDIDKLLKLVDIMKLEYDNKNYVDKSKNILIRLINNGKEYKDIKKGFTHQELEEKSKDDLMRLMFWASHKKKPICEKIKEWFEKNNLIETIVSKK